MWGAKALTVAIAWALILVTIGLFVRDLGRASVRELSISPFWYFTLIFLFAYPIRGLLIVADKVIPQVAYKVGPGEAFESGALALTDDRLAAALLIVAAFWLATYVGYTLARFSNRTVHGPSDGCDIPPHSFNTSALVHFLFLTLALGATYILDPFGLVFGDDQSALRAQGRGVLWLLLELFVLSFIVFLATTVVQRDRPNTSILWLMIILTVAVAAFEMYVLASRRIIAAVVLSCLISLVIARPRFWLLGPMGLFATFYAANILELLRYIRLPLRNGQSFPEAIVSTLKYVFDESSTFLLSTSFEGIEHVAQMLGRFDQTKLLTGIDHGVAWLFNAGLAFMPRSIWSDKPLIYGGIEQFRSLYPGYFESGINATSIPMSYVVDLSYGFGICAGLILAFFLGRLFAWCQIILSNPRGQLVALSLALFTLVFMFNIVRSGTVHFQGIILIAAICAFSVGPVSVAGTMLGIIRLVALSPFRRIDP